MKRRIGYVYIDNKEIGKVKEFKFEIDNGIITFRNIIQKSPEKTITLELMMYQHKFLKRMIMVIKKFLRIKL